MSDYGERNRSSSIFSDDDRDDRWRGAERDRWRSEDYGWGGNPDRSRSWNERGRDGRTDDDRGFLSRAGDEIRSWFGDEEAERRRDEDARRWDREQGNQDYRSNREDQWAGRSAERSDFRYSQQGQPRSAYGAGGQSAQGRGRAQQQGDTYGQNFDQVGEAGFRSSSQSLGGSPHDDSYRRWRDRQIAQLDSEYDEYCRHRQQQFEQDFSSFRRTRQAGGQQNAGSASSGSDTLSAANALSEDQAPEAETGTAPASTGRAGKGS